MSTTRSCVSAATPRQRMRSSRTTSLRALSLLVVPLAAYQYFKANASLHGVWSTTGGINLRGGAAVAADGQGAAASSSGSASPPVSGQNVTATSSSTGDATASYAAAFPTPALNLTFGGVDLRLVSAAADAAGEGGSSSPNSLLLPPSPGGMVAVRAKVADDDEEGGGMTIDLTRFTGTLRVYPARPAADVVAPPGTGPVDLLSPSQSVDNGDRRAGLPRQAAVVVDAPRVNLTDLTLANVIWSKNWHRLVRHCPTVPPSYYSDHTESTLSPEELTRYFVNCTGTIWLRLGSVRLGSTRQRYRGDVPQFIRHVLPHMTRPFRLITTDGDRSAPSGVGRYRELLDHPLCRAWFTQNYDVPNVIVAAAADGGNSSNNNALLGKLRPIPIGPDFHTRHPELRRSSADDDDSGEDGSVVRRMVELREIALRRDDADAVAGGEGSNRKLLPFIPPWGRSNRERRTALNIIERSCNRSRYERFMGWWVGVDELWDMYSRRRYGLSPRGNGMDCHRTWEMLFFGMIPIVKSGPLDRLYDGLPIIVVQNWTDVCREDFIREETAKLPGLHAPNAVLTIEYWVPPEEDFFAANDSR